jgi:two-component system, NarL family, nitrate/nitrite response regulator NarL
MSLARPEPPRRSRAIRVAIASGEPLFGDAMGRVIRQCARLQLVGQVGEGRAALELLRTVEPDVAVLGPGLGDLDADRILGLASTEDLRTRLVFVGDRVGQAALYDLLGKGAAGFLTTSTGPDELCDAVLTAAAGDVFLARDVHLALAREIRLRVSDDRPVLSTRELEVLQRIAAGERVPAMGRAMHLSASTVKTHVHHLYDKLEVSDRAAAVAVAMRRGLLD